MEFSVNWEEVSLNPVNPANLRNQSKFSSFPIWQISHNWQKENAILGSITVQILLVKIISDGHPLLEFGYLNKYTLPTKIRSGRNAYCHKLN